MNDTAEITTLLHEMAAGDAEAFDRLVPAIYEHLRRIARSQLGRSPRNTLETTALVHEAYLKLAGQEGAAWRDRHHFYAACAQAMRHILVDAARRRMSLKRGQGEEPGTLPEALMTPEAEVERVLAVHDALDLLRSIDPVLSRTVECRFFAGLTGAQTALALGVSERTAHRYWLRARAWLEVELGTDLGHAEPVADAIPTLALTRAL